MSLSAMSYINAQKIVDLFSDLLINLDSLGKYEKFGYSDLKGYDIIDIDNALKIITAYKVFCLNENNNEFEERKKYSSAAGGAVVGFHWDFFPDEIAQKIRKLDPDNKDAALEYTSIALDNQKHSKWTLLLHNQETHNSFLEYCISIKGKERFWEKVYHRLKINLETSNDKDPISLIVNNKYNFQNTNSNEDIEKLVVDKTSKKKLLLEFIKKLFK